MVLQIKDVVNCLDELYSTWNRIEYPHDVYVKSVPNPKALLWNYE